MKKNRFYVFLMALFALVIGLAITGCASTPPETGPLAETVVLTVSPGLNESVIVIQRNRTHVGSVIPMRVWVNGEDAASGIRNGDEIQLIVANGEYTIQAGSTNVDKGNLITFNVNGEAIIFSAEPRMGLLAARFNLAQTGRIKL